MEGVSEHTMIKILMIIMALMQGTLFYPTSLEVTDIKNGMVTFRTCTGIEHQIEHAESWQIGDPAAAIMYSNGTRTEKDDEIIQIRYTGWGK